MWSVEVWLDAADAWRPFLSLNYIFLHIIHHI
jgi:hypothetical protein